MATEPTATAANSEYSPSDTLKPANSIVASLGMGMQADSRVISTKMPSSPSGVDDVDGELDDGVGDGGEEGRHGEVG